MNKSLIEQYFTWIKNTVNPSTDLYKTADSYLKSENPAEDPNRPFLSVITRTQGKRPHMLNEMLLCLTGQEDTDFELLIMGHNLTPDKTSEVESIISDLPEWLRLKTRYFSVEGGTRTTPLNRGFQEARGKYIAILDDDDIVFANWVSEFKKLYEKEPGKVFHTYVFAQDWEVVKDDVPRAFHSPLSAFCSDYMVLDEIYVNTCPISSLAFPSYAFQELGIHFNETLTTTEDWDYLMRVAILVGVANSSVPTGIYRNWVNAENSKTIHTKKEWDKNREAIVNQFLDMPILLEKRDIQKVLDDHLTQSLIPDSKRPRLYYDKGEGFSETDAIRSEKDERDPKTEIFDTSELPPLSGIRLDPCDLGGVYIDSLDITIVTIDGAEYHYDIKDTLTNGRMYKGKTVFIKNDPNMVISFRKPRSIQKVIARYDLHENIPDEIIDRMAPRFSARRFMVRNIFMKFKRFFGSKNRI